MIDAPKLNVPYGAKPEKYAGNLAKLIIPAANFLNESADFGWLADLIEQLDLPCIVFGLGAQSEDQRYFPVLKEGTQRFLLAASKRTTYLGVRGEFSKLVCRAYGVDNVEVMGCPSILLNPNKRMGEAIQEKWKNSLTRIAVHAVYTKENTRVSEQFIFDQIQKIPGSAYIIQRPVQFIKEILGEEKNSKEIEYFLKCAQFIDPASSLDDFKLKLHKYSYIPYSVDSWVSYLMHFSHAIGTRIHGTILSLSGEIPAICIHHDTRTRELCDTLMVPSIAASSFQKNKTLLDIFEETQINGIEFDQNRIRIAQKNMNLIKLMDLKPSKHLVGLVT